MFDVGFSELVVIGIIGLLVLGPKRLPELARTAGHWLGRMRRFVSDVKQDIDREMQAEELAELRRLREELEQTRGSIAQTAQEILPRSSGGELEILEEPPAPAVNPPAIAGAPAVNDKSNNPPTEKPKRVAKPRTARPDVTVASADTATGTAPAKRARKPKSATEVDGNKPQERE